MAVTSIERGTISQFDLDEALGNDISEPKTLYSVGSYVRVKTEDMVPPTPIVVLALLCLQCPAQQATVHANTMPGHTCCQLASRVCMQLCISISQHIGALPAD